MRKDHNTLISFYSMEPNYPFILMPPMVIKIIENNKPQIPKPIKPTPPKKENIYKPSPPKRSDFSIFCLFYLIIASVLFYEALRHNLKILTVLLIFTTLLGGWFIMFYGLVKLVKSLSDLFNGRFLFFYDKTAEQYNRELDEYDIKDDETSAKYINAINDFRYYELSKYEEDLNKYEMDVSDLKIPEKLRIFKVNSIRSWLARINSFSDIPPNTRLNKGVSENYFLHYLDKAFPGRIKSNICIPSQVGGYSYVPDFVFYDQDLNLYIDIEIDEPYIGYNLQPIHYIGSDDKRDIQFNSKGWVVIRFAEVQIIRFPDQCIDYISKLVNCLLCADPIDSILFTGNKIKRWSHAEAQKLCKQDYRNIYLPPELQVALKHESELISDKFL